MSSQDNLERVLRDIHVLISRSESYSQDRIIVNKQEMFGLIDRLNASIYEIMEEYELTKQSRDKAEREHKKKGERIIWDASRKAEDIYAASVMYTDEALGHVQTIMDDTTQQIRELQDAMIRDLEEKKQIVRENQLELKPQLQDLVDTEKYLLLIEERNKEIQREKEKYHTKFGGQKEKSQFADVKTEIKINKEYFRNAGIELEDEEASDEDAQVSETEERNTGAEESLPDLEPLDESVDIIKAKEADVDLSHAQWDVAELEETPPTEQRRKKRRFKK